MKRIIIEMCVSDEAMTGKDGWGNADASASIDAFLNDVRAAVKQAYPDYTVLVVGTDYAERVDIEDEREPSREVEDDQAEIREIVSEVFQLQTWYR